MKMSRLAFTIAALSLTLVSGCGGGGSAGTANLSNINGRVIDQLDRPVSGAQISLIPAGRSRAEVVETTITNGSGSFQLTNVEAGTYTLVARTSGSNGDMIEVQVSVTVPAGSDVDIQIRIILGGTTPGAEVPNPPPGTGAVMGTVFDSLGRPVAGATVTVINTALGNTSSTTTAANGAFTLNGLPEGATNIYASNGTVESVPFLVYVSPDTVVQTDIYLPGQSLPQGTPPGTGGSGGATIPGNGHALGHIIGVGHHHHGNGNGNGHDHHDHDGDGDVDEHD